MSAAIYGVSVASPFFQNRRLTNENEELRAKVHAATSHVANLEAQTASLQQGVSEKTMELRKLTASLLCAQAQGAVRVWAAESLPRGGKTRFDASNLNGAMAEVVKVADRMRVDDATKKRVFDVWLPLSHRYSQPGSEPITVSEFAYELWAACDRVALGGQLR
jgi:hypothetical protein